MPSPPPQPRSQPMVYCCEQDHGEPSRSPPRHDSGLPLAPNVFVDISETPDRPSSRSSVPSTSSNSPGRTTPAAGGRSTHSSTLSTPALPPLRADECSDVDCDAESGSIAVFGCCGLPLASGCRPVSPLTGCEIADGCLECPDCRLPPRPCADEFACELTQCELSAVGCTSPECATSPPCFDQDCNDECGAVECEVDHVGCSLDDGALASDILDCCGHEHSWACEEAPPLFGDFEQLLDCCPSQLSDFTPSLPGGVPSAAVGDSAMAAPGLFPSSVSTAATPSTQQTTLSAFQALIDAAVANQSKSVPGANGASQLSSALSGSIVGHSYDQSPSPFAPACGPQAVASTSHACEVPCLWSGCEEVFPNVDLLLDHFRSTASHLPVTAQPGFDQTFPAQLQTQPMISTAHQQAGEPQASADVKTTQEILEFLNQTPSGNTAQMSTTSLESALPLSDPFSVQCQWGGHPHTLDLANLVSEQPDAGLPDVTLSPTNLFLRHLMDEHLAGVDGLTSHLGVAAKPSSSSMATGDDAASSLSTGLGSVDWSTSTPQSFGSNAGTPTSIDGGFLASALHPHSHHHPAVYHHHGSHHHYGAHLHLQQHFHAQHHPHSHPSPSPHSHHQHTHPADCFHPPPLQQQHVCSIDPPTTAASAARSQASQSRNAARHHPYRAPSEATTPHHAHAHAHHGHGHHVHAHLHGRHLLPSVKGSPSSRSSISSGHAHEPGCGSVQDDGLHVCGYPGCGLVFEDTSALTDHLDKVHVGSGKKEYACGWAGCERALHGPIFKSKQKIMRHLQSHTGHKPFVCQICNLTFSEAATLQQHVRRHSKDKPHVCDHDGCAKAFPLASSLAIHKRTHDEIKPFQCPHCARCFTEASNLNKHIRTHTGEKPFECRYPGCSKRFARPDQLSRHQGVHTRKEERERLTLVADGPQGGPSASSDDESS